MHNVYIEIFLTFGGIIGCLRSLVWLGTNIEKFAATEYHHHIITHTKSAHSGRLDNCSDCFS